MLGSDQQTRLYSFIRFFRIGLGIAILTFLHFNPNIPQIVSLLGNIVCLILVFPIIFIYFDLYEKLFPDAESHHDSGMNITFINEEKQNLENGEVDDALN